MLTGTWFAYALVAGSLVAVAAWALDGLCRAHRLASRWSWALGLVGMVALLARSSMLATASVPGMGPFAAGGAAPAMMMKTARTGLWQALVTAFDAGLAPLGATMAAAARLLPDGVERGITTFWLAASAVTLAAIVLVHLRIARVRRGWPRAELHGHTVRIAPAIGPAVLGVVQPFIVVPRWLLARSDEEQRLVLEHENEHVRGGDHLLLAGAWLVAALVPWHPAAWWMLSRLRLAMELDCDARVLARGVGARIYGSLLIDLAGQCAAGSTVGATALADESSHLERRLLAMKPITSRHAPARAGALLAAGLLAVLAACEAKVPTSAEVEKMDVAGVQRAAASAGVGVKVSMNDADFIVDGTPTTAEAAHAIPSDRIASVNVTTATASGRSLIAITTGAAKAAGLPMTRRMGHPATGADSVAMASQHQPHANEMSRTFAGVMLLDGVKVDNGTLARLQSNDIASVEVIKGAEAQRQSADPAAVNGLIRITTKAAAKK